MQRWTKKRFFSFFFYSQHRYDLAQNLWSGTSLNVNFSQTYDLLKAQVYRNQQWRTFFWTQFKKLHIVLLLQNRDFLVPFILEEASEGFEVLFSMATHQSLAIILPPHFTIFATKNFMLQESALPKNWHFPNFTKMTQLLPGFSDFVTSCSHFSTVSFLKKFTAPSILFLALFLV